jgi:cation diffusion facilitator CzcD-associated flavoprotein CzcO
MTSTYHVAVVGAGPYGLAVAAHLRDVGVEARVIGQPMAFWRQGMARGMLLRSEWPGSHIADPHRALTLDRYEATRGTTLSRRLPLSDLIDYGLWYQRQAVPDLDPQPVTRVEQHPHGFAVALADGNVTLAERVIVATGLTGSAYRPPAFAGLPSTLAPHSTEIPDPAAFAGRRVAVIGAGQSAVELAVLLGEAGADVELIARAPRHALAAWAPQEGARPLAQDRLPARGGRADRPQLAGRAAGPAPLPPALAPAARGGPGGPAGGERVAAPAPRPGQDHDRPLGRSGAARGRRSRPHARRRLPA